MKKDGERGNGETKEERRRREGGGYITDKEKK